MNTYVKNSKLGGKGLFAQKSLKKGSVIGIFQGVPTKEEHIHTLWTSDEQGLRITNDMKYSNHDFQSPNAYLTADLELKAKRHIKKDEEICWDYSVGHKYTPVQTLKPLFDNQKLTILHHAIMDQDDEKFINFLRLMNKEKLSLKAIETITCFSDQRCYGKYKNWISTWVAYLGTPRMAEYMIRKKLITKSKISTFLATLIYYERVDILSLIFKKFKTVYGVHWDDYINSKDVLNTYPCSWLEGNFNNKTCHFLLHYLNEWNTNFKMNDDFIGGFYIHDYVFVKKDVEGIKILAKKAPQKYFSAYMRAHGNLINSIKMPQIKIDVKNIHENWIDFWSKYNGIKVNKFMQKYA